MKTYKHLYPQLCAFENLYEAFRRARRGKRSRPDVAAFEDNLEVELPALQVLGGWLRSEEKADAATRVAVL